MVQISLNYDVQDNVYAGGVFEAVISQTTFNLIWKLIERDSAGQKKYGTTLDRNDLTEYQWLTHLQEELLDGAGYVERLKREKDLKASAAILNAVKNGEKSLS